MVQKLQLVRNVPATLLTGSREAGIRYYRTHVELHQLRLLAQFKVLAIAFNTLNSLWPDHLKVYLHPQHHFQPVRLRAFQGATAYPRESSLGGLAEFVELPSPKRLDCPLTLWFGKAPTKLSFLST